MTREERNQRKRSNRLMALCIAIIAVWVFCLALSTSANAAFDAEAYKTGLSCVGAVTLAALLMRAVVWLDTPRRAKK